MKKSIIILCLMEIISLLFLQRIYGNVLDVAGFIVLLIFLMVLNFFMFAKLSKSRTRTVLAIQIIFLIFIPVYSIFNLPSYTYHSAKEKVVRNSESSSIADTNHRQVILIENDAGELRKGYLFELEQDKKSMTYAFDPWAGTYYEVN